MVKLAYKILLILFLLNLKFAFSQLYTDYAYPNTIDSLIRSTFEGSSTQIANISFKGYFGNGSPIFNIGYFNGQNTSLGLKEGIILSGTSILSPYGLGKPAINAAQNFFITTGDSILEQVIGVPNSSHNAVIIEFDFIPNGDSIFFEYVFASDEYPQQLCTPDNDVFAFHISGPGYNGLQNIALVPGTNLPVSVNSINDTALAKTIIKVYPRAEDCISVNYPQYYVDRRADINFIFNGSTTVLTAKAATIPCQTYHLRLGLAETGVPGDASAVFLKANSFNSEPLKITSTVSYEGPDTLLYEGCGQAQIVLRRTYNLQQAKTYTFNYSGTATYGVDYSAAPTQITMQPGQMYDTLSLVPFADGIADNGESIIISVGDTLCNGDYFVSDITLIINEKDDLSVKILPLNSTSCDTLTFSAEINNGIRPFLYDWNNGLSNDSVFTYFQIGKQTIFLQLIDGCAQNQTDTVLVHFDYYPVANFSHTPEYVDIENPEVQFIDASSGNTSLWFWDFSGAKVLKDGVNPIVFFNQADTFWISLRVANELMCFDSVAYPLVVYPPSRLFVPNSFSPNDDKINDYFNALGSEINFFELFIFDRWGEMVFYSNDKSEGWNGKKNDEECPQGEYAIKINYSYKKAPEKIITFYQTLYLIK